ncbi:MAG: HIT domain-containing protein [Bifidobacteriaceae bacterium]|jgi:histidine triad (HIT) family protein|nr:HIT domain-containing protein [Bifidobacteriaceae bacterium]
MNDCIFCKIIVGDIPSNILYQDELLVAFPDLNPTAKMHILVVPKNHQANVSILAAENPKTLQRLVSVSQNLANQFANGDYRLIFNTGSTVGQSVFHVHAHVVGGETLPE